MPHRRQPFLVTDSPDPIQVQVTRPVGIGASPRVLARGGRYPSLAARLVVHHTAGYHVVGV